MALLPSHPQQSLIVAERYHHLALIPEVEIVQVKQLHPLSGAVLRKPAVLKRVKYWSGSRTPSLLRIHPLILEAMGSTDARGHSDGDI